MITVTNKQTSTKVYDDVNTIARESIRLFQRTSEKQLWIYSCVFSWPGPDLQRILWQT